MEIKNINLSIFALIVTVLLFAGNSLLKAQRLSRDHNVNLLVNQAGYLPQASKTCLAPGAFNRNFEVIDVATQNVVFTGQLRPTSGDFGEYSSGDFSGVSKEGTYYILSDTLRSFPFRISRNVYEPAINLIVSYFSKQRCGGSATGYLTPCHLDDGVRMDNGKHQDVSGGWHDASDLRKWISATIYGMIGMAKVYELLPELEKEKTIEELLWGNRYFLNMQEPDGYIMSYIGGDVLKHSDSNRWTDNITGDEEGELGFTKPNTGKSTADMLIIGSKDDRVIKTDPLDIMGQYNFITAEAMMTRITKERDLSYSKRCLEAAKRCFAWSKTSDKQENPRVIGASIQAALELYKTTKEGSYADFAADQAKQLREYQELDKNNISGFFYSSLEKKEPYNNVWNGCMELSALCDMIQLFPEHKDVALWKDLINRYARNYLITMARKNNFGIVPFGLYTQKDPGGNRKDGEFWYRYFMQPEQDWWVGINSNIAAAGIGLLKASKVLNDQELKSYAQKQLDWIIGLNPLNSSTLIGIGYNHPKHFPGSTFYPQTPVIPGAVMNGLGGDHDDQPTIGNGNWQISEYWTPMVAHTLWLMAELSIAE
ncbi:MAG: glycoside hydrolase family 9 protein [Bacteroidetes bacterium]|nr:glycoside hydrolase family 9 protein [Bacteroidota bacterium]MDA1121966.1 glycoside hydrolase family 9 protein [Bacteroidota bacterium]